MKPFFWRSIGSIGSADRVLDHSIGFTRHSSGPGKRKKKILLSIAFYLSSQGQRLFESDSKCNKERIQLLTNSSLFLFFSFDFFSFLAFYSTRYMCISKRWWKTDSSWPWWHQSNDSFSSGISRNVLLLRIVIIFIYVFPYHIKIAQFWSEADLKKKIVKNCKKMEKEKRMA